MSTVLSHIVQEHLSKKKENTATEVLDYILHSSEPARSGLMKLLRGIAPNLPSLKFRTQKTDDNARPDMWGYDGNVPRVFIENKFWAAFTKNQPVKYLKLLAKQTQPTVLLIVVPAERQKTTWRELRLKAKVSISSRDTVADGVRSVAISRGRILALTSWKTLLDAIKKELQIEDVRNNLNQLVGLCDAASQAFVPMPSEQIKNKQTPDFILQLSSIVQRAVAEADERIVSTKNTLEKNPRKGRLDQAHTWKRTGRYICFPRAFGVGAWLGTEFTLWKDHGSTPLWLVFGNTEWQRGSDVRDVLEPWASRKGIPTVWRRDDYDGFAVGIKLMTGADEASVIASVVSQLTEIAKVLPKIGRKRK